MGEWEAPVTRREHIREAERLLEAAKEIARRPKETEQDRKGDAVIALDLQDFARTHAAIALAIGDHG
jgi:hypothetical protein